jgi:2,3-bisphosphoglycerate-dependent phosphoglycerate mutase
MTTIIIARHGNTFDTDDKVVRVGARTDLPLSSSGKLQAQKLGTYFKATDLNLSAVFTSCLSRTIETATIALEVAGIKLPVLQNSIFNEVDYGPDEGKTEQEVIARIGQDALDAWEHKALVPQDWLIDPDRVIRNWFNFAADLKNRFADQTVLVVTSNGIARFAPYLTGNFLGFTQEYNIKLSTAAIASLTSVGDIWQVDYWNKKS